MGGVGEENAKRHFERVWAMGLANKPYRSKFLVVQQSVRNHPSHGDFAAIPCSLLLWLVKRHCGKMATAHPAC